MGPGKSAGQAVTRRGRALRHLPLEAYVFFGIPLLCLLGVALLNPALLPDIFNNVTRKSAFFFILGGQDLAIALLILYAYLIIRVLYFLGIKYVLKRPVSYDFRMVKSLFFIAFGLVAIIGTQSLAMDFLGAIDIGRIKQASENLMFVDQDLFGSFVPFSLQDLSRYPVVDVTLVAVYRQIGLVTTLVFFFLLMADKHLFRKFVLSFVLVGTLGIPVWFAVPALSPDEMYLQNITATEIPHAIADEIEPQMQKISAGLREMVDGLAGAYSDHDERFYNVTSLPSMHAAWGAIAAFYACLAWPLLAVFFVPWLAANTVSTVYTIQHYAVDAALGLAYALIVIVVVNALVNREKERHISADFFLVIDLIQHDVRAATEWLRQLLGRG